MTSNYPPGVFSWDPNAPWNQKDEPEKCDGCGSENVFYCKTKLYFNGKWRKVDAIVCRDCWNKSLL